MSSASAVQNAWVTRDPWLWAVGGTVACALSGLWLVTGTEGGEPARLGLVWAGLLATGVGVALRFRIKSPSRLQRMPGIVQLALALTFAILGLGVIAVLVASWFGHYLLNLRPGLALILAVLLGPLSLRAAWQCLERLRHAAALAHLDECALTLVLGSFTANLGCFALGSVDPERAPEWYTLQHFLFILGLVALAAAPLAASDGTTRRWVVSGLILFHFGGIATASLGSPPTPWVITQLWTRIYRPYLEFLYLNNAYHFYSPEPGPPSYLWFRVFMMDDAGNRQAAWYKVPRLDENGRHGHSASLEYQRDLSLTENTMPTDGVPIDSLEWEKLAERRAAFTPDALNKDVVIGKPAELPVPLHPMMSRAQQYRPPQAYILRFLETYTRHVARVHIDKHPTWKFQSVRVYRVIHNIPQPIKFALLEATDPEFYSPIYMGEYDERGRLLSDGDPLLYWILPIVRDPPLRGDSLIRDWARRHAGDPYWLCLRRDGFSEWIDEKLNPAPQEP